MKNTNSTSASTTLIFAALRRRGVRLRVRDGQVAVCGHRLMTPGLWDAIAQHHDELLVALEARSAKRTARVFEFRLSPGGPRLVFITPPATLAEAARQLGDQFDAVHDVRVRTIT